jgi:hypothetical protein
MDSLERAGRDVIRQNNMHELAVGGTLVPWRTDDSHLSDQVLLSAS